MKYTRYDYRRKKEEKISVAVIFISIILAAVLLGTALSSLFIKNQSGKPNSNQNVKSPTPTPQANSGKDGTVPAKVLLIQSGFYKVKENAADCKAKLKDTVNPFQVDEADGGIRVFAGIFNEGDSDNIIKTLSDKGMPPSKVTYEINIEDQSSLEISEIIKGHLKCLTKLLEQNVASVKTDEFKTWLSTLSKVDEKAKYYSVLEEYKKYIGAMPADISKDKAEENYVYIYNVVKKVGIKK